MWIPSWERNSRSVTRRNFEITALFTLLYDAYGSGKKITSKIHIFYTKFWKIIPLLLSYVVPVKSKGKILQNFVAFSDYMKFKKNNSVISWKYFVITNFISVACHFKVHIFWVGHKILRNLHHRFVLSSATNLILSEYMNF